MNNSPTKPLRLGLAGVSHDHISILGALSPGDFEVVGVFDSDPRLLEAIGMRFRISAGRRFTDLNAMLRDTRPDGVAAFGSIYDHLAIVEACAPMGIHVMVEKPLAISPGHAERMSRLATMHDVHLLTNYETTWYPSIGSALTLIESGELGPLRKVLVRTGHSGPVESGCQPQFLRWLLDAELSGGGALSDFGCYGANLLMRLAHGRLPQSVTATARTFKPEIYPGLEDDAVMLLGYPDMEAVIQASWAWPFSRKDVEFHCRDGFVAALDARTMVYRGPADAGPRTITAPDLVPSVAEPFAHFAAVIRRCQSVAEEDLPALVNNLGVVTILDAARQSASSLRTMTLF